MYSRTGELHRRGQLAPGNCGHFDDVYTLDIEEGKVFLHDLVRGRRSQLMGLSAATSGTPVTLMSVQDGSVRVSVGATEYCYTLKGDLICQGQHCRVAPNLTPLFILNWQAHLRLDDEVHIIDPAREGMDAVSAAWPPNSCFVCIIFEGERWGQRFRHLELYDLYDEHNEPWPRDRFFLPLLDEDVQICWANDSAGLVLVSEQTNMQWVLTWRV